VEDVMPSMTAGIGQDYYPWNQLGVIFGQQLNNRLCI
jgi:hypothetical protein